MSTTITTTFLPYKLTLRAPAIATALSGDPNSAVTQPFIPGGAIRGAVAARLLAEGEPADGELFRELILTGAVRYLHAYPVVDGQRAMPAPQSWRSEKARPDRARDLAAFGGLVNEKDDAEDLGDLWPQETLVSLGAPFAAPSTAAGARSVVAPQIDARLHQQRDRVKGRPWSEQLNGQEVPRGAIFAYEYLEPRQVFRGLVQVHLRAASPADADHLGESRERLTQRIQALLDRRSILVGRSRRAGYGGDAEILFDAATTDAEFESISGGLSGDVEVGHRLRMVLVSAYIGRHPDTGQLDPEALPHELRSRGLKVAVERRRWSFETVGSFNQKWRLEVPQARAASAGSVLVLKAEKPVPLALLRSIEREGIGERRVDGFGRILFLEHAEGHESIRLHRAADLVQTDGDGCCELGSLSEQDRRQLGILERRIVLAAARAELDRVAAIDLTSKAKNIPTNSLLGRLRTLFRRAADERAAQAALENLRTWCGDGDSPDALKKKARKQLDRCNIRDGSFRLWLRRLAESGHGDAGWEALVQASGNPPTLTALAARRHLTARAAAEAVLHVHSALLRVYLIDSVLGAMACLNRRGVK